MKQDRGRVHLPDMIVMVAVFAGAVAMAPVITSLTSGMSADPMTQLLFQALPVMIFIGIVVSLGVSAVRDD